ncbi:hypothetical protein ACYTPF_03405 [Alteromonas sp. HB246098]
MDKLTKEAYSVLSEKNGFSQFFDRGAKKTFALEIMRIIDKFLINGASHTTSLKLEQLRQKHFSSKSR